MLKATTIKDAIKRWEEKHPSEDITKATYVGFQFQYPPIEKMDNSLAQLSSCTKLSLSTNMIEKIAGISSLKHLKILSLGRNYIKNLNGLEGIADNLEELWISYNQIEKLRGVESLKKMKVLYMMHNLVKDWSEFNKLQQLPMLEELSFLGNPLQENTDDAAFKSHINTKLPNLKKLDGEVLESDDSKK